MPIPFKRDPQLSRRTSLWHAAATALLLLVALGALRDTPLLAQGNALVLDRDGRSIVLEPYAPNILRITLSLSHEAATAKPGYGFIAQPAASGWTHPQGAQGAETYRSSRMTVQLSPAQLSDAQLPAHMPLDQINNQLRDHYFGGPADRKRPPTDTLSITTASGRTLLTMRNWNMVPNSPDTETGTGASTSASGSRSTSASTWEKDPGFRVAATFASPADEHYYGLGQQQQGAMDLRDHRINCWHDYVAIGGQNVCVPFMVSTAGYGLVWDNPSKTTIDLGFNNQNVFSSAIGDRVSFFVIAGDTPDEIYSGYRLLTGITHILPRATYGYIQSKAIYPTQEQTLDIARQYRDRHLPLDVLVVDFLNGTRQGQLDLDPARWPDPAAMNNQLRAEGVHSLVSVWPHFAQGTDYYDMLKSKGWLIHDAAGVPDEGGFKSVIGPNIDTTNPDAAKWWWEQIRDRFIKHYGFDYIWLDETEPDIDPVKDFFSVGSGARFYNVYPLFHTAAVYEGSRRDFGDSRRVMSLVRASYLGAQRNGTVFWSSDITSTWDMLKRSIPAGLNFTASGMPYWDTDIAGFFSPALAADYQPAHKPLIDISGPDDAPARANVGRYADYPELFVRWFEWGAFQPIMRAHGERTHNEVWAYGHQAETILSKYLRLRYQLLPYTYSLAYATYQTGAPYTRELWMDFPHDPKVLDLADEYMYGPAFLVAPVTEQGATTREVYLPAGTDWYNYWTNEKLHGGQTITVQAPIDTLPLFVKAGSILPLGSEVLSASAPQTIASVKIYPGADADFTLFSDDGSTYSYEKGLSSITTLHWNQASQTLSHEGAAAWRAPDNTIVQIVGR